jgi:hypothetical protein
VLGNQSPSLETSFTAVDSFWAKAVEGYSKCDLTKPDDKLVAISGLARKIKELHPRFDFIAGMLRQSLCTGLLWHLNSHGPKISKRPTGYRAPSWSWASVGSGVLIQRHSHTDELLSSVLDINVQQGDDPMGQTISATLKIKGYLMTANARYGPEHTEFCVNKMWNQTYQHFDEFRDLEEPFRNLHCLVLNRSLGKTKEYWLHCLLLQPIAVEKGLFRRYGTYTFAANYHKLSSMDDLKCVHHENWLEYESISKDGKYVVSIV